VLGHDFACATTLTYEQQNSWPVFNQVSEREVSTGIGVIESIVWKLVTYI
jgi:hypothetical protein